MVVGILVLGIRISLRLVGQTEAPQLVCIQFKLQLEYAPLV